MDNLPAGWIQKESSKHPGKMYYFNKTTGESSWLPPKDVNANIRTKDGRRKLLKVKEHSGISKSKTPAQDRLRKLQANLLLDQNGIVKLTSKQTKSDAPLLNENAGNANKGDNKTVIKPDSLTIAKKQKTGNSISGNDISNCGSSSKPNLNLLNDGKQRKLSDTAPPEKNLKLKRTHGPESSTTLSKVPRLAVEALCKIPKLVASKIYKFRDKLVEPGTSVSTSAIKGSVPAPEKDPNRKVTLKTSQKATVTTKLNKTLQKTACGPQLSAKLKSANERLQNLRRELEGQRKALEADKSQTGATSVRASVSEECSPMDWEEIEEQINDKITEIRQGDASDDGTLGDFYNVVNHNLLKMASEQSKEPFVNRNCYHFVVDTNVLLRNLSFIEDLKKFKFGSTKSSLIVVPYCVLQELDRIKMRSNQAVSTLAVRAIKYLNEKFERKDENIKGQSAIEANNHLIKIENADDNILNCCLQIKEETNNILLLTNDVNLRNKAICNKILVSTKSDLEAGDINLT